MRIRMKNYAGPHKKMHKSYHSKRKPILCRRVVAKNHRNGNFYHVELPAAVHQGRLHGATSDHACRPAGALARPTIFPRVVAATGGLDGNHLAEPSSGLADLRLTGSTLGLSHFSFGVQVFF